MKDGIVPAKAAELKEVCRERGKAKKKAAKIATETAAKVLALSALGQQAAAEADEWDDEQEKCPVWPIVLALLVIALLRLCWGRPAEAAAATDPPQTPPPLQTDAETQTPVQFCNFCTNFWVVTAEATTQTRLTLPSSVALWSCATPRPVVAAPPPPVPAPRPALRGSRDGCTECSDFDLCDSCYRDQRPALRGSRDGCTECSDFDLCAGCSRDQRRASRRSGAAVTTPPPPVPAPLVESRRYVAPPSRGRTRESELKYVEHLWAGQCCADGGLDTSGTNQYMIRVKCGWCRKVLERVRWKNPA